MKYELIIWFPEPTAPALLARSYFLREKLAITFRCLRDFRVCCAPLLKIRLMPISRAHRRFFSRVAHQLPRSPQSSHRSARNGDIWTTAPTREPPGAEPTSTTAPGRVARRALALVRMPPPLPRFAATFPAPADRNSRIIISGERSLSRTTSPT